MSTSSPSKPPEPPESFLTSPLSTTSKYINDYATLRRKMQNLDLPRRLMNIEMHNLSDTQIPTPSQLHHWWTSLKHMDTSMRSFGDQVTEIHADVKTHIQSTRVNIRAFETRTGIFLGANNRRKRVNGYTVLSIHTEEDGVTTPFVQPDMIEVPDTIDIDEDHVCSISTNTDHKDDEKKRLGELDDKLKFLENKMNILDIHVLLWKGDFRITRNMVYKMLRRLGLEPEKDLDVRGVE